MGGVFTAPGKENQKQKGIQQWAKTLKFWDKRLNSELRFAHRLSSTFTLNVPSHMPNSAKQFSFPKLKQNNKWPSRCSKGKGVFLFATVRRLFFWVIYNFISLKSFCNRARIVINIFNPIKSIFCTNFTSFWCRRWTVFYEEISRWDLALFLQEMKMLPITIVIPVTKCKIFPS